MQDITSKSKSKSIPLSKATVYFNAGGHLYSIAISGILKYPDSTLATMIQNEISQKGGISKTKFFIGSDSSMFAYILDYYRNGQQMALPNDRVFLNKLQTEAEYYRLPGLEQLITDKKKGDGRWKVGDYVRLDLKNINIYQREDARELEYWRARPDQEKSVELKRASIGLFNYQDLERKLWGCPHGYSPFSNDLKRIVYNLMHELKPLHWTPTDDTSWFGRVVGIDGQCIAVKFCHQTAANRYLPTTKTVDSKTMDTGFVILHCPEDLLKRA